MVRKRKKKPFVEVDLDDPVLNAYMLFVQTASAVDKYAEASFYQRAGLSSAWYIVLQVLAVNEGSMKPSQIAHWTLRERHNITTLVDRMQKEGLLRREQNIGDKRFVNITLTDKGREALSRATPVARETVNRVMASLGERSITQLIKSLNILRQNAHEGLDSLF